MQASGFDLVTGEEHATALANPEPADELMAKSVPGGPSIELMSPAAEGDTLASPIDIEVRFLPVDGASIDMDTLKIYYLMLIRKDVTSRILEHAEIGDGVLRASGAELPKGKHRFLLEISDSENRKASRKFSVTVGS